MDVRVQTCKPGHWVFDLFTRLTLCQMWAYNLYWHCYDLIVMDDNARKSSTDDLNEALGFIKDQMRQFLRIVESGKIRLGQGSII